MDGRGRAARYGGGAVAMGIGTEPWYGRAPHVVVRAAGLRLRTRLWEALCGARPRTVLGLELCSLGLLAAGLRGCAPAAFWAGTGGWAVLLAAVFALLRSGARPD
ncbi:hypothetical protein ACFCX4_14760 [Kitasatospora sp. NPDC056327]|uniref:hypothetical protein n=1 Tax=Kitasatospora sp. NPDC056327 TaxID=3345785 RepID=UPI0035DEA7AA